MLQIYRGCHSRCYRVLAVHPNSQRTRSLARSSTTTDPHAAGPAAKSMSYPRLETYLELSKPRLSTLVLLTTMSSYALTPFPAVSLATLGYLSAGTWLCCASANAYNMWLEPPFDSQMVRTRNRPIVRGAIRPEQAFTFACGTGVLGASALWFGVNPVCCGLGILNIVLYAAIYTPLKRSTVVNTWVGAIVGGIPPLMGWAAASPSCLLGLQDAGGWLLALLLYTWQFPHFNSLAWYIRNEYARAGYIMTSITNPAMNARVSLRYSLLTFPICYGLVYTSICDPFFSLDSSLVNGYLAWQALQFWRTGHKSEREQHRGAKRLFFASLIHLPAILALAMLHKKHKDL